MKLPFWTIALIISILIVSNVWATRYDPDLMVYYPYEVDEIVGDTVLDFTGTGGGPEGTGYHGTINGDITLVDDDIRGKVAKFTTGSYIDVHGENIPAEEIPTAGITLCAWVKCEDTGDTHTIFNARASDTTYVTYTELRSMGQFRWSLRGNGNNALFDIRGSTVEWDTWFHYAGTYDKSKEAGILYINGLKIKEAECGKEVVDIAGDWSMGARVGYNVDDIRPFTGLMDDFCIWKRGLTREEIVVIMEKGIRSMAVSPKDSLTITWGRLKQ